MTNVSWSDLLFISAEPVWKKRVRRCFCLSLLLMCQLAFCGSVSNTAAAQDNKKVCENGARCVVGFVKSGTGSVSSPYAGWEAAVNNASPKSLVIFAPGVYTVSQTLVIKYDMVLRGAGSALTTLIAGKSMPSVLANDEKSGRQISVRDLTVDANHLASHAILFDNAAYYHTPVLESVFVKNATSSGIVLRRCQLCQLMGVSSVSNAGGGIEFWGCNGTLATAIATNFNAGDGISVRRYTDSRSVMFSGGMSLLQVDAESNSGSAVNIVDTRTPVYLYGAWIEGNGVGADGVRVSAPFVSINSVRISGKNKGPLGYAIHILPGGDSTDVRSAYLSSEQGDYARVKVENGVGDGTFQLSVGRVDR